jgi:tRNA(Ile)-lysidine synthase
MLTTSIFFNNLQAITSSNDVCIALSGGLDSSVLLYLFYTLRSKEPRLNLRAVHAHHGLSIHADKWLSTCEMLCKAYQIPLLVSHLKIKKTPQASLENVAREGRYEFFKGILKENECLVTGHHQNDQAETLLLQLFRGAGPKGLAAMPSMTAFGKGFLIRPLLSYKKAALLQFALDNQLKWIEDESNYDVNFDRNFLRSELMPLLEKRWPAVINNLARVARHCAQADYFIGKQLDESFQEAFDQSTNGLRIDMLLKHDALTQNYLLRYWLQYINLSLPSTEKLKILREEILGAKQDAMPLLRWRQVEVRRYHNQLYAMPPLPKHDTSQIIPWNLEQDLMLPGGIGRITINQLTELGLKRETLENVTIRFRQGGECCRLKNRKHSHSLKKLFQTWCVPPWQRDRVPLLYANDHLKAIIGYAACE